MMEDLGCYIQNGAGMFRGLFGGMRMWNWRCYAFMDHLPNQEGGKHSTPQPTVAISGRWANWLPSLTVLPTRFEIGKKD